jgi:hypothetical protein
MACSPMPTCSSSAATRRRRPRDAVRCRAPAALADDVAHQHARIHGREGVLEDDLQVLAIAAHAPGADVGEIGAVVLHGAAGGPLQLQDALADRGLAAAGLADQGQGSASAQRQIDAVDGLDLADGLLEQPTLDREVDL